MKYNIISLGQGPCGSLDLIAHRYKLIGLETRFGLAIYTTKTGCFL